MAKGRKTGGRKKGTFNKPKKKQLEIIEKAAAKGITPLEVMLDNMRFAHQGAKDVLAKIMGTDATAGIDTLKELIQLRQLAEECAKDAAPYMHARLQAIQHMGEGGGPINARIQIQFVGASAGN